MNQLALFLATLLPLSGTGSYTPPPAQQSALAVLATNMGHQTYVQLTPKPLLTTGPANTNYGPPTPATCDNYDGLNAADCNNSAAGGTFTLNPLNGYQQIGAVICDDPTAFSGQGVSIEGHYAISNGGGHASCPGSDVYRYDIYAAAAQINAGQPITQKYTVITQGARFLQAGCGLANPQPRPTDSNEVPISPGFPNCAGDTTIWYWYTHNAKGQFVSCAGHMYFYLKQVPGTRYFNITPYGCWYANSWPGQEVWINIDDGSTIGPLVTTAPLPASIFLGSPPNNSPNANGLQSGNPYPLCMGPDGTPYIVQRNNLGTGGSIYRWAHALDSAMQLFDTGGTVLVDGWGGIGAFDHDCVIVKDPTNPNYVAWFAHSSQVPNVPNTYFTLTTGIGGDNNGTPKYHSQQYAIAPSVFCGGQTTVPSNPGYTRGPNGDPIIWQGGFAICDVQFTWDGTNLTANVVDLANPACEVASPPASCGDVPPDDSVSNPYVGGRTVPIIQYVDKDESGASVGLYILSIYTNLIAFKP